MKTNESYILIADTDSYSGNFEREMIAYATGLYCIRGEAETQNFKDAFGEEKSWEIAEYAIETRDENNDDRRPEYAHIWPTPDYYNNGMGFSYRVGQEDEALEHYKKSCYEYAEKIEAMYAHLPDYGREQAMEHRKKGDEALEPAKYQSFQSVALTFSSLPPQGLLNLIKSRCIEYAAITNEHTKPITIQRFRIIKRTTVVVDHEI